MACVFWLMAAKAPEKAVMATVMKISWYLLCPRGFIMIPAAISPTMTPVPVETYTGRLLLDLLIRVVVFWYGSIPKANQL